MESLCFKSIGSVCVGLRQKFGLFEILVAIGQDRLSIKQARSLCQKCARMRCFSSRWG
jgi:hypothetical protein